jgi:hypothetical protein
MYLTLDGIPPGRDVCLGLGDALSIGNTRPLAVAADVAGDVGT